MINCMLKWNIKCLKSNINAESCKQIPYDRFKHMSLPAPLRSMPWLRKTGPTSKCSNWTKTRAFYEFLFFKASLIYLFSPLLTWFFYFAGDLSHDLHCHLMGWLSIGKQGLRHCNTGPRCHNKAAGWLYIPLCFHCISILRSSRTKGLTELTMDCHLDLSSLADMQKWMIFCL